MNQTYTDNEIIIVDDGSTNGIESFCDELTHQYRITVIHQTNQGLASARNTGIRASSGDWIVHVDGDDWVDVHLSECLVSRCLDTDADIVVWGYSIYTGQRIQNLLLKNKAIFNTDYDSIKEDVICSVLGAGSLFLSLSLNTSWAKAYKRSFIEQKNLYYDVRLRRAQDVAYNLCAFDKARSVQYIDKALSVYRNDNESLSRGYNTKNIEYITMTANVVRQFIDTHYKSPKINKACNLFIQRCFRMINEQTILNKKNNLSYSDKKKLFNSVISQDPFHSAFQSGQKRSELVWFFSDLLYEYHLFVGIQFYNRVLKLLYRLKHIF